MDLTTPTAGAGLPFLYHFDAELRFEVGTEILKVIRAGAATPEEVVEGFTKFARRAYASVIHYDDEVHPSLELLAALENDPDGALRLAEHYLEIERHKSPRADLYRREWQRSLSPTDTQLAFLAALGWRGEVPDRKQASELIDRLRNGGA